MELRRYNHYHMLPADFATQLRREWYSKTVDGLILAARVKGWSLRSMGEALGVSGEAVRLRSIAADPSYAQQRMDEVPELPAKPVPEPRPVPMNKRDLPAHIAAELRALQDIARTVNGTAREKDPRRAASVELAYRFASLLNLGYSPGKLAAAAGVTRAAVMMRVRRHGYAPMWDSMGDRRYGGHAWFEREESA